MKSSSSRIQLIARGDDAGSCESADLAIVESCDRGILRNVSIMVPGPSFEHAARLLAGRRDLCLGLHVTLNAEWFEPRWGPVLPVGRVPSLVDARGHFLPTPGDLNRRGFDGDQVMAEVEGQLRRAREAGLKIGYVDEHRGVGWLGGLRTRLSEFARREGLVEAERFTGLPQAPNAPGEWLSRLRLRLAQAAAGVHVLGTHPGLDRDDMRRFHGFGLAPGVVARERDAERLGLTNPSLPDLLREYDVDSRLM